MVAMKRQAQLTLLLAIVNAFELNFKPDHIKAMVDYEWAKYTGPFEAPENPRRCTCLGDLWSPVDEDIPLDQQAFCDACQGYRPKRM